jgi:CheY-like chemotaxis protein
VTGERILVVDDNPTNSKLARLMLQAEGYEVRTAADAEGALSLLGEYEPHLVLMDVQLPGMNGLELTRRIRASERLRHLPILALTAYAMPGDRDEAIAAGCSGFLAKPVDMTSLPTAVASLLAAPPGRPR